MSLTSTHEDYIEAVYRRISSDHDGVRVSDIAEDLGCRMPTVTRTVRHLVTEGYFEHESRGLVRLTSKGEAMAKDIAHRHDDVVAFLHLMLGLTEDQSESDACQIEHGFSPLGAERLHRLLNYFETLPSHQRKALREAVQKGEDDQFSNLQEVKGSGWRV